MKTKPFIIGVLFAIVVATAMGATHFTGDGYLPLFNSDDPGIVQIEDNTAPPFEAYLSREINDVTITSTTPPGENNFTLAPGHGFVVGDFLETYVEWEVIPGTIMKRQMQLPVVAVATNDIITGVPVDALVSPTTVQFAKRVDVSINEVSTELLPAKFQFCPANGIVYDATRLVIEMVLSTQPDDALFGDIGALTNGMYFGFEGDAFVRYLVHVKDNAGFRGTAYDVTYSVRSGGGGSWGMAVRKTFAGQEKYGVAIRLNGPLNECFVAVSQDDLSGLVQYRIKLMGHEADGVTTLSE
jgi:hypothetical protein